ncbi:MAG: hypothetical protein EOL97_13395 [Spirochaetia bacterium]|nr:hypothetical protein [Spirochaetia bacterium]
MNIETRKKISNSLKGIIPWNKGKKMSDEFRKKISNNLKERQFKENNPIWKGNNVKYQGIHQWIRRKNGKAHKCENRENGVLDFKCSNKSNHFHWAIKKEKEYSRDARDYYQLCRSCHNKYDNINTKEYVKKNK